MPVGVVKDSEDERHWSKAKTLAAKQGHAKDWPYIMGIFQKMSGKSMSKGLKLVANDLQKSTTAQLSPQFILTKWPGQVPSKENIDLLRYTKQMPSEPTLAQMMSPTGAYMTPDAVIDGLGLDTVQQAQWKELLNKARGSSNELVVRHEIVGKMLADRMPPEKRRVLFAKALSFYRDMRKSLVSVVTVDELRKGEGGEGSRGGHVIGHTSGGKAIYEEHHHGDYDAIDEKTKNWGPRDHQEAAQFHENLAKKNLKNVDETPVGRQAGTAYYGHNAAAIVHTALAYVKGTSAEERSANRKLEREGRGEIRHIPGDAGNLPQTKFVSHSLQKGVLSKSTGEGSRGGQVIGRTSRGNAIYASGQHAKQLPDWTAQEHHEASAAHQEHAKKVAKVEGVGTPQHKEHLLHVYSHQQTGWDKEAAAKKPFNLRKSEKTGAIVDKGEQGDPEERLARVIRVVSHRLGNAGPEGLSLDKLSDVIKTYGQPLVAQALNKTCAQGGSMTFKKGLLQLRG